MVCEHCISMHLSQDAEQAHSQEHTPSSLAQAPSKAPYSWLPALSALQPRLALFHYPPPEGPVPTSPSHTTTL